jgi:thiamine pyrophosphokinase
VAAGDFNAEHFAAMHAAGVFDYVIAVDGGLRSLEEAGFGTDVVDVVVGDFDSLGYIPHNVRTLRYPPDKDASDTELALKRARSQRMRHVYVYGALGGRLDHTVSNLQTLAHESELGQHVTAIGDTHALVFLTGEDIFEAEARESGTVSVFSMSERARGVFIRGLKWELDDAELTNRVSRGLSNELKGEAVMIGVEEGTLLIFFPL